MEHLSHRDDSGYWFIPSRRCRHFSKKRCKHTCCDKCRASVVQLEEMERLGAIQPLHLRQGVPESLLPSRITEIGSQLVEVYQKPYPPGVYFLLNGCEVCYVGQTVNLMCRLGDHQKSKRFSRVLFLPTVEAQLDFVERHYIDLLLPLYNKDARTMSAKRGLQETTVSL